jgi:hypothetical protein
VRHVAFKLSGTTLQVFYSRIGDSPESLLMSEIELAPDWTRWTPSHPVTVLTPEMDFEGADVPVAASTEGAAPGRVRELRDPDIFIDGTKTYLLYSVAGESGIAIAALKRQPSS